MAKGLGSSFLLPVEYGAGPARSFSIEAPRGRQLKALCRQIRGANNSCDLGTADLDFEIIY